MITETLSIADLLKSKDIIFNEDQYSRRTRVGMFEGKLRFQVDTDCSRPFKLKFYAVGEEIFFAPNHPVKKLEYDGLIDVSKGGIIIPQPGFGEYRFVNSPVDALGKKHFRRDNWYADLPCMAWWNIDIRKGRSTVHYEPKYR